MGLMLDYRWRIPILWVGVLILAVLAMEAFPKAAQASWAYTPYVCAMAGCKYGQYRVAYDSYAHQRYYHRGATASGTCDPSNDVVRWRVSNTRTYENGSLKNSDGPFGWHDNCALATYTWTKLVPRDYRPGLMQSRGHYEWDVACSGCDFDEFIWTPQY